jgi:DNA mismatch repair ATPase MutS
VTVVLAQSIHTCVAESYAGPPLVVRTCIGRADDPASGKSYYLVEVQAVLEMVHAAQTGVAHLMLFDELFRGTNAVERISAGEAVLATLLEPLEQGQRVPHIVIAATHDLELVEFLAGAYASAHFADSMDENGLSFDYRLRSGAATTRNAIAVLRWRGAPDSLVARALARADALDSMRAGR